MSFGGFIARRVVKGVVNGIIDNVADSEEDAKSMKEGARWLITGVGLAASILTADPVGFADSIVDHGADVALDHGIDTLADHGTDAVVEHASSYYDPSDHGLLFGSSGDPPKMVDYGYGLVEAHGCDLNDDCKGFVEVPASDLCGKCHDAYHHHY